MVCMCVKCRTKPAKYLDPEKSPFGLIDLCEQCAEEIVTQYEVEGMEDYGASRQMPRMYY